MLGFYGIKNHIYKNHIYIYIDKHFNMLYIYMSYLKFLFQ